MVFGCKRIRQPILSVILVLALTGSQCLAEDSKDAQVYELLLQARAEMIAGRYSHAETLCEAALFLDSMNPIANAMMRQALEEQSGELPFQTIRLLRVDRPGIRIRLFRHVMDQSTGRLAPYEPRYFQNR